MKKGLLALFLSLLLATTSWAGPEITSQPTYDGANVAITGGTITGITDLAIADGGTGAGTAATAFTALKQDATLTATGAVELATDAETVTGTSDVVVATPGNITARLAAPGAIGGTTPAAGHFTTLDASGDFTVGATTRITMGGAANDDGIVFASLGTATKAIDFTACGLAGAADYWLYCSPANRWTASGLLYVTGFFTSAGGYVATNDLLTATDGYDLSIRPKTNKNIVFSIPSNSSILKGNRTAVGTWAGDGVSNGTTTITDVGGAAHGLSLAVGDLVHITDSTTAADEGFYRITADDGTDIVLDRALTGAATNLAVTFYKDVIGFFATDGTNGQHLLGFSHQDKPLVIGGDRAGTGAGTIPATGHSLGGEDILIGGKLEVDGDVYFDGDIGLYTSTGAYCQVKSITEEVTIAVAAGNTPPVATSGNLAPASSLILGVTFRVTDAPGGGAATIDIGRTGGANLDEFIDGKSCDVLGETGNTLTGDGDATAMPLMNATADTLTLTTNADVSGDGMKVRVTVFYIDMSAPTA